MDEAHHGVECGGEGRAFGLLGELQNLALECGAEGVAFWIVTFGSTVVAPATWWYAPDPPASGGEYVGVALAGRHRAGIVVVSELTCGVHMDGAGLILVVHICADPSSARGRPRFAEGS